MDASLFLRYKAAQASAAHAVSTSLAPHGAATSNTKKVAGVGLPIAAQTARPQATSTPGQTTGTSSSVTDSGSITSSDFLTLLVSELKNQDPTTPTDPNTYITQLVGVNSLEQLISINSGVTSLDTSATATKGTGLKVVAAS